MRKKEKILLSDKHHVDFSNGKLSYSSCSRSPKPFKEELINALGEIIALNKKKEIYLFLSGGGDSETIGRCLMKHLGVKFIAVTIVVDGGINSREIRFATQFCKKYKLKQIFFHVQTQAILSNKFILQLKKRFNCASLPYLINLYVIKKLYKQHRLIILGTGEPALRFKRGKCYVVHDNDEFSIFRYAQENNYSIISNIFMWNPETYLSFFLGQEMGYFIEQKGEIYKSFFPLKIKMYKRLFGTPLREKRMDELFAQGYRHENVSTSLVPLEDELKYLVKGIRT